MWFLNRILLFRYVGVFRAYCGGITGFWWFQLALITVVYILVLASCHLVFSCLLLSLTGVYSSCKPVSLWTCGLGVTALMGDMHSLGRTGVQTVVSKGQILASDVNRKNHFPGCHVSSVPWLQVVLTWAQYLGRSDGLTSDLWCVSTCWGLALSAQDWGTYCITGSALQSRSNSEMLIYDSLKRERDDKKVQAKK